MKIGMLITARLKSTRLPKKLLLDINGKSLIERVIDRAKEVSGLERVILCTSNNPQDRPLVDLALKNGIPYFLGSEEDVLDRLNRAADFFGLEYFLSITGENPFFSLIHANRIVKYLEDKQFDFIYSTGLPIGTAVYGLNNKALKVVCYVKKEIDTEIWGPLLNRPEIFKIKNLEVEKFYNRPELRLTTDYPEDYEFIKKIYSHFLISDIPSLYDILNIIDKYPEYLNINKNRKQAGLSESTLRKINTFYEDNQDKILLLKKKIYEE